MYLLKMKIEHKRMKMMDYVGVAKNKKNNWFKLVVLFSIFIGIGMSFVMTIPVYAEEAQQGISTNETIYARLEDTGRIFVHIEADYKGASLQKIKLPIRTQGAKFASYSVGVVYQADHRLLPLTETASGTINSFFVKSEDDHVGLQVTLDPNQAIETIVVDYQLDQQVTNYLDLSFYEGSWPLLSTEPDSHAELTLELPKSQNSSPKIKVWTYGQANQLRKIENQDSYSIHVNVIKDRSAKSDLKIHVAMPLDLFPSNPNQVDQMMMDTIDQQESAWTRQEQARLRSQNRQKFFYVLALLALPLLPSLGLAYYVYQFSHLSTHSNGEKTNFIPFPPEEIVPSLVKKSVFYQEIDSNDLAACLLSLGSKGYLKILPVRLSKRTFSKNRTGYTLAFTKSPYNLSLQALTSFEKTAYDLVTLKDKETVTLEQLLYLFQQDASLKESKKQSWKKFKNNLQLKSYQPKPRNRRIKQRLFLMIGIVFVISLFCAVKAIGFMLANALDGLIAAAIVLLILHWMALCFLVYLVYRRSFATDLEERRASVWRSYGQFLNQASHYQLSAYGDLAVWERNIAYAISLNKMAQIQKAFTRQFNLSQLEEEGDSLNGDLYRVPDSLSGIFIPALKEYIDQFEYFKAF